MTTTMTRGEAIAYIRSCDEDEGPETLREAREIFAAVFGRRPDADDGTMGDLWSQACAAASTEVTP